MIKYLDELIKLNLKKYVIIGSGALAVRNIRENNDLDILVDDKIFQELKEKYGLNEKKTIEIGHLEILDNFKPWFDDVNLLIEDCDIISDFRFMKLKYLIKWKINCNRKKDQDDLKLVEEFLKKT